MMRQWIITTIVSGAGGAIIGTMTGLHHLSWWWTVGVAGAWGLSVACIVPYLMGGGDDTQATS